MLLGRNRRAAGSKSSRQRIRLSRRDVRAIVVVFAAALGAALTPTCRSAIAICEPRVLVPRRSQGPLSGRKLFAICTGVNTKPGQKADRPTGSPSGFRGGGVAQLVRAAES